MTQENMKPGIENGKGPVTRQRPIAVDLFAGAGGLSLGFEQAGFDIAAAVEFDPIHAAVHEYNFPYGTTLCANVRDLDGASIRARAGLGSRAIDVVVGGPPCQGFSLIGQRVLDDPRNSLVLHFMRLVSELRPRLFVMENVPGMATAAHTQLLRELIAGFDDAGYRVRLPYRILNAADYGVPQDRKRLVLLGARKDCPLPNYPAPTTNSRLVLKSKGAQLPLDLQLPATPCVNDALGDLPDIDGHAELADSDELRVRLRGGSNYARMLRGELVDPADFGYPRMKTSGVLTGCRAADHSDLSRKRFAETTPGDTEPVSRFFRLPPQGLCNTLRAGTATDHGAFTAPRPIHPQWARCISVREAARLHSYPDWFRLHRTVWHGFRQIGNSVPPLLGRAVAHQLMLALGIRPVKPAKLEGSREDLFALDMKQAAARFGVPHNVIPQRRRTAPDGGRKVA